MQATVKVIAIALDGGTWDVLDWFINAGYMPHLKRLKEKGTYTNLLSTCPPSTVPAWPSIVTGKNPGAQGIYGFFTRQLENYELRLTHATERKGRVFWHYLGAEGIRVGILNIPLTYPPCPVNGFLVSGMMSPTEKGISYPEDFEVELKRKFNYRVSFKTFQRTDVNFVRDLKKGVELRTKAALLMLDKGVDFLMLMFRATDLLQHKFWRELEEIFSNSKKGNAKKLKEEIIDFYSWVDECVGELVRNGGDDSIVMIFSDHGFGPRNRIVNLNNWLVKKRYLVPSRSLVSRTKYRMFRLGLTPKLAFQMVDKVKLGRIKSQAGFKNLTVRWQPKFFFSLNNIDWGRSLIYSLGAFGQGIWVNLKGREPQGCVEEKDYESLRDKVIEELKDFRDPENNRNVIKEVYKREEIYSGEYVNMAPDIIVEPHVGYDCFPRVTFSSTAVVEDGYFETGTHRPEGIFLVSGRGIQNGVCVPPFPLFNIAPTILHLFHLKVPRDMDGRVMNEIFDRESGYFHRVVEFQETQREDQREPSTYSPQEEETIKARLRDLGYID